MPDGMGELWLARFLIPAPGLHGTIWSRSASCCRPTPHLLRGFIHTVLCNLRIQRSLRSHGLVLPVAIGNSFSCSPTRWALMWSFGPLRAFLSYLLSSGVCLREGTVSQSWHLALLAPTPSHSSLTENALHLLLSLKIFLGLYSSERCYL